MQTSLHGESNKGFWCILYEQAQRTGDGYSWLFAVVLMFDFVLCEHF